MSIKWKGPQRQGGMLEGPPIGAMPAVKETVMFSLLSVSFFRRVNVGWHASDLHPTRGGDKPDCALRDEPEF